MKQTAILFIFFVFCVMGLTLKSQTYCIHFSVAANTATDITIKISLVGSTSFSMADGNLAFYYDGTKLSSPTLVSNTLTGDYYGISVTDNTVGVKKEASFNYAWSGPGSVTILTTDVEIVQIKFMKSTSTGTANYSMETGKIGDLYKASPLTLLNQGSCASADLTLPLEYLDFQAKLTEEKKVALTWVTASEVNVKNYVVERSTDGTHFETISNPVPANNSLNKNTYQATDENPKVGVNYYRVLGTDFDGKQTFTLVHSVYIAEASIEFKVFPNPAKTKSSLIIFTNWDKDYDFKMTDLTGRLIFQQLKLHSQSVEISSLDLATGSYIYECSTANSSTKGKLIITE